MKEQENLVGRRFGRLVVEDVKIDLNGGGEMLVCLCDCGNQIVTRKRNVLAGKSKSCGCLQKEIARKINYKHGCSHERLYHVWDGMKQRCNNPNHAAYKNYGGRGIKVCEEWEKDYTKFREFMLVNGYNPEAPFGECTIDRINNDGDYCPENCRVISVQEQQNSKSDVFSFILDGKRTTVTGAARTCGKTRSCIQYRLAHGWSLDKALEEPLRKDMTFEANKEVHTIKEWAQILGVTDSVIRGRLQTHTIQEIVDEYNKNGFLKVNNCSPKFHTVNGVTRSQKE